MEGVQLDQEDVGGGEERGERVEEGREGRRKEGGRVTYPISCTIFCAVLELATGYTREKMKFMKRASNESNTLTVYHSISQYIIA